MATGNIMTGNALLDEQGRVNLSNQQTLALIREYAQFVIDNGERTEGYELMRGLEDWLNDSPELHDRPSELSRTYNELLDKLRGLVIGMLSDTELEAYMEHGIAVAIKNTDVSLVEGLQAKMIGVGFVEDRDALKEKLLFRLRQNQERLTLQPLTSSTGVVAPTVRQWILVAEHNKEINTRALMFAIQDDEQFQKLNQAEQNIVLRLMTVADYLSLPSSTPQGFEEVITFADENGDRYVIDGGQVRPAFDQETVELYRQFAQTVSTGTEKTTALPTERQVGDLQQAVSVIREAHAAEDEARYEQQENLLQEIGGNIGQVVTMLREAVEKNNAKEILTATAVLTRAGAITDALKDTVIREKVVNQLLKPVADAPGVSVEKILAAINAHPDNPRFVGAAIRWLLEQAFPGNESESARVGNQIENILAALGNPALVGMTYFDVAAGSFRWTPLQVQTDGSVSWVA